MRRHDRMRNLNNYDKAKTDGGRCTKRQIYPEAIVGIEARTKEGTREKGP